MRGRRARAAPRLPGPRLTPVLRASLLLFWPRSSLEAHYYTGTGHHLFRTNHTVSVRDKDVRVKLTDIAGDERGACAGSRAFAPCPSHLACLPAAFACSPPWPRP